MSEVKEEPYSWQFDADSIAGRGGKDFGIEILIAHLNSGTMVCGNIFMNKWLETGGFASVEEAISAGWDIREITDGYGSAYIINSKKVEYNKEYTKVYLDGINYIKYKLDSKPPKKKHNPPFWANNWRKRS